MRSTDAILAAALALAAAPAFAQNAGSGALPGPEQAARQFAEACLAEDPAAIPDQVDAFAQANGFDAIRDEDTGQTTYAGPDELVTLTAYEEEGASVCEMGIATDAGDFGRELEDAARRGVADHLGGTEPEAQTLAGGMAWSWEAQGTASRVEALQSAGLYLLRYVARAGG